MNKHHLIPSPVKKMNYTLPPLDMSKKSTATAASGRERYSTRSKLGIHSKQTYQLHSANFRKDLLAGPVLSRQSSMDVYNISIKILSNYGDPNSITCSEIDFLDKSYRLIPVIKIEVEPRGIEYTSLDSLTNGTFVGDQDTLEWSAAWDGRPVILKITITSDSPPSYVRIWNGSKCGPNNIKEVAIEIGKEYVTSAIVPQNLGVNVSLKANNTEALKEKPVPVIPVWYSISDMHGSIPLFPVSTIIIDFLEGVHDCYVGLNKIEFLTPQGRKLKLFKDIKCISWEGGEMVTAPQRLFARSAIEEFWIGKISANMLNLIVQLEHPTKIALIRLWGPSDREFAIRRARIRLDGRIVWTGQLSFKSEPFKKIWLTDVPEIKSTVRKA